MTQRARRVGSLAVLLVIAPATGLARDASESGFEGPALALGAFGLGAVGAGCLVPAAMPLILVADGDRPPQGLLVAGWVCGGVQLAAGAAYTLRDEPTWQRDLGWTAVGLGATALVTTTLATVLQPEPTDVAIAPLWSVDGSPMVGLSMVW